MLLALFAMPTGATEALVGLQEKLLQIDINRQQINETVLLLEDGLGELYVASTDLERWHLQTPAALSAVSHQGERYFPLRALLPVLQTYDPLALTLVIELPPEAFLETSRRAEMAAMPTPVPPELGGFLNYELFAANSEDAQQRSGQWELGVFNPWGVGVTGLFVNQLASQPVPVRLDTTWTHDVPAQRETWRFGDTVSTAGTWGQSLRFAGVQYATNFGTEPGFATFTPQSVAGQALMPSTVDVFINNALVSRQSVPPGPFTIDNLPVVSGSGQVQVVVRDLFGRERLVQTPFYASQALLRQGLRSFAYEAGFVRQDFGQQSDNYGPWLATATLRQGLSDQLTGELHAETTAGQATLGAGADYLLADVGTMSAYLAGSSRGSDTGGLLLLGIDRLTPRFSVGARAQKTTDGFAQLGSAAGRAGPSQLSSANLSFVLPSIGAVGVAYISQVRGDEPETRVASLSYSVSLAAAASLSVAALTDLRGDQGTQLLVTLSVPLGPSITAGGNTQLSRTRAGHTQADYAATVQRNLPSGSGYGYRLQTRNGPSSQGSLTLQNDVGTYTVDALQDAIGTATQLSASGGFALVGGHGFASRRIDESFALVTVPGYANVGVLADNQSAGHTDANGNALIPRLRAYDRNVISIAQEDLPMDAEIGALSIPVVPYFRSGLALAFPVKRSRAATFTVILEDGGELPNAAVLTMLEPPGGALLGAKGEVYATDLQARNPLRVQWKGQQCDILIPYVPADDPLPDLGTFVCKGVLR